MSRSLERLMCLSVGFVHAALVDKGTHSDSESGLVNEVRSLIIHT